MLAMTKVIQTFPSARIPSMSGGLAVEVSLIAQLGHGSGNHLFSSVVTRQRAHEAFVDELDEPSAKLASTDFSKGDPTALYSFVVGPNGHPFHRHAGHRIFTAIAGSGGCQLRFSTASPEQIEEDPYNFIKGLQHVNIPPDCLFTVRFGGETWHQFAALKRNSLHPVFFALSCHTNELGGALPDEIKAKVLANQADIPSLTVVLPQNLLDLLQSRSRNDDHVPTIELSLDAPAGTFHRAVCNTFRGSAGFIRGSWAKWKGASGFVSDNAFLRAVKELKHPPEGSLLLGQLADKRVNHDDTFCLSLKGRNFTACSASALLGHLLEGFLMNPPTGVSRLMMLRNLLVRPIGLRTSPLGCPVSSLLATKSEKMFANQYPVLDQAIDAADRRAQVILGADDKHLVFRSCVGIHIVNDQCIDITLGTRVHCKNLFGKFYMALISLVHRTYITPTMLRLAVDHIASKVTETTAMPVNVNSAPKVELQGTRA